MGKIAVLGLGPSLKLFNASDFDMSVGVNDIWRYHHSEVIVCLDKRTVFNADRYSVIAASRPEAFYSQIVNWDFIPGFVKLDILPQYCETKMDLTIPQYYKSFCSPFIAAQVAYKCYKAKEIHLFGIDLLNHPHLDLRLCSGIKKHFTLLAKALRDNECQFIVHGEGILKDI